MSLIKNMLDNLEKGETSTENVHKNPIPSPENQSESAKLNINQNTISSLNKELSSTSESEEMFDYKKKDMTKNSVEEKTLQKETVQKAQVTPIKKRSNGLTITLLFTLLIVFSAWFVTYSGLLSPSENSHFITTSDTGSTLSTTDTGTATAVTKKRTAGSQTTTVEMHKTYASALDNLNRGNVKQAMKELKTVVEKDPSFTPAQQKYKMLRSKYIIGK